MSPYHSFLALIVAFIWGTNFVVIAHGLEVLPPLFFAFLRFFCVAFPLILIKPFPNTRWYWVAAFGLAIAVGQFGVLFYAMKEDISPGLASLVVQTQVFFTIVLAAIGWHERLRPAQSFGLFLGFIGLLLVAINRGGDVNLLGFTLVLLAALSWSLGNLVIKRIGKIDSLALIAWSSLYSLPLLFGASMLSEFDAIRSIDIGAIDASIIGVVLWQSIGNSLIGYGIWNYLLTQYPSSAVTPWALLVPMFGIGASIILGYESFYWWKGYAAAFVVAGVALITLNARPKPQN